MILFPIYPDRWDERIIPGKSRVALQLDLLRNEAMLEGGRKVGIICVAGWLENFDLRNTDVPRLAMEVDHLALWFAVNSTMEGMLAFRTSLMPEFMARESLFQMNPTIRRFIDGIENQTLRRVVMIGANVYKQEVKKGGLLQLGDSPVEVADRIRTTLDTRWVVVPKTMSEREEPPGISDIDLAEVVRWLIQLLERQNTLSAGKTPEETHARRVVQLSEMLRKAGLFSVTPQHMSRVLGTVNQNRRKHADPNRMVKIIPGWEELPIL
jgi:hypothetical protein